MKRSDWYRVKNLKTGKLLKTTYFWFSHIPERMKESDNYIIEAFDGKDWYCIDD